MSCRALLGENVELLFERLALYFQGWHMKKFILLFFLLSNASHSQQYPKWFLFPGEMKCSPRITVITSPPTYYRDSAIAQGFRMGCDLLARYTFMQLSGGQTFWATEAGISSMGAKYEQHYDTSLVGVYLSSLKVLQSYVDKEKTLVLVGDSSCSVNEELNSLISLASLKQPAWVEELPIDRSYQYGVGFSEQFYYDISSWQWAEKNAYMAIARSIQVKMQSLQKLNSFEGHDIRNEEINVTLRNVEIVARWKDMKKKIFYVLARMRK